MKGPIRPFHRVFLLVCLAVPLSQCGSDGPSGPNIQTSQWPSDAVGIYSRTVERRVCSPFECHWLTLVVDTVQVCSSPLPSMTSERFDWTSPVFVDDELT